MTLRAYVAFDDTDTIDADRGTGKVGRWFGAELPDGCRAWCVVRQQLLVHPDVPYTSHNSAAVVIVEIPDLTVVDELTDRAARHLERHWMEGSDPGLCVAWDGCPALPALAAFGRRAAVSVVTQTDAYAAAVGAHLSGHGGSNDGVIGAAAGVGLTADGWSGRLIDYLTPLRDFADPVRVSDLHTAGIHVVAIDRDAPVPLPDQLVATQDWMRPRLWGGRLVLPVRRDAARTGWEVVGAERRQEPDRPAGPEVS